MSALRFKVKQDSGMLLTNVSVREKCDALVCVGRGKKAKVGPHSSEYNVSLLFSSPSVKNIRWFSGEMSKLCWRNRERGGEREREREGGEMSIPE